MRRTIAISVLVMFCAVSLASADLIFLKKGKTIEVDNVKIVGDKVTFTVFNGRMSIALSAVARIEKTSIPARADAGLVNTISGQPYSSGITSSGAGSGNTEATGSNPNEDREKEGLIAAYIKQKQQMEKELQFYKDQIQILRSVIYAKVAIFSDTEQDRANLKLAETKKAELETRLNSLLEEARRAGLDPGDIRRISGARTTTPGTGGQITFVGDDGKIKRDANINWINIDDDDKDRYSKTTLEEEQDDKDKDK